LVNNSREIYLMDIAKTELRRLTFAPCMEERPSWSKDGKWIYFASDCSKKVFFEIWKIRSDGAGGMRQVTFHGGYEAFESWDGMSLYYVKSLDAPGLWKVSPDGGDENPILDSVTEGAWSMAEDGIYFFNFGTSERSRSLQFYSFANSRTELIYQTHADATRHSPGLAARRDGRSILVALLENQNSEINVVDPFELLGSRRDSIP
jgi:Tol biopolymer transport system component